MKEKKPLTQNEFNQAIKKYRSIVGNDNVFINSNEIAPYLKCYIPVDETQFAPIGAISVNSVEQVQAILAVSNRYGIPLWPISTGRNFGYGTALPAVAGQMILDLRKMDRILNIDEELGTALVEPGVTYQQLYDHLQENNIPLNLSVPGPGPLVGPVGQALIRGEGYTSYAEQFTSVCGMEVVMADGEILRTGLGGIQNSTAQTWQSNKFGYGPYLDGIFSQSNFGIVTKLGFWLMPKPEHYEMFTIVYPEYSDIENLINISRNLKINDVVRSPILVGPTAVGMALGGVPRSLIKKSEEGHLSLDDIKAFARKNKEPAISGTSALHGTKEQIAANLKYIEDLITGTGGKLLYGASFDQALPETLKKHFHHSYNGIPDLQEFALLNWKGGGGLIWFAPICPAVGRVAMQQIKMMQTLSDEFEFDFIDAFFHNGRSMVHLFNLFYDRSNDDELQRAYDFYTKATKVFAEAGFGVYRSNPAFMQTTANVYGSAQSNVNKKIKQALDPNGIIAPGMSGITL